MESIASSSSPPEARTHHRFRPTQPVADRVIRALRHHLLLLHRSDSVFFVLGATGNVYTVNLSTTMSCTCPDRTTPCKHILFVLIRVLGVTLDSSCLWRRTLRPCQLERLLALPTLTEALAGDTLRERFHQLFFQATRKDDNSNNNNSAAEVEVEDGSNCPVCLEELKKGGERIVACRTCRNPIHEECLMAWKRSSSRRRSVSCVICRARWRDSSSSSSSSSYSSQERYLNLSAYISNEDNNNNNHTVVANVADDDDNARCRD